jgi:hypothetical protein
VPTPFDTGWVMSHCALSDGNLRETTELRFTSTAPRAREIGCAKATERGISSGLAKPPSIYCPAPESAISEVSPAAVIARFCPAAGSARAQHRWRGIWLANEGRWLVAPTGTILAHQVTFEPVYVWCLAASVPPGLSKLRGRSIGGYGAGLQRGDLDGAIPPD